MRRIRCRLSALNTSSVTIPTKRIESLPKRRRERQKRSIFAFR
jgi:hypothetical protein